MANQLTMADVQSILTLHARGLSARRIARELGVDRGTVGRHVRLSADSKPATIALTGSTGSQQAGNPGAPGEIADGKRSGSWVLRVVLSHSRKGYSEAVARQTTDEFLRCLENAFNHFGGVPRTLVIDNLRAAVKRADWFDPELCPRVSAFAQHY